MYVMQMLKKYNSIHLSDERNSMQSHLSKTEFPLVACNSVLAGVTVYNY